MLITERQQLSSNGIFAVRLRLACGHVTWRTGLREARRHAMMVSIDQMHCQECAELQLAKQRRGLESLRQLFEGGVPPASVTRYTPNGVALVSTIPPPLRVVPK